MFNSRRFIFPQFNFAEVYDNINLDAGEITWKLSHAVYDKDENFPGNLKRAYKLTYKSLHPGDKKQSLSLALSIFDATNSAAIESYYPDHYDASGFLKFINLWWTISNSKQRYTIQKTELVMQLLKVITNLCFCEHLPIGWKGGKLYKVGIRKNLL